MTRTTMVMAALALGACGGTPAPQEHAFSVMTDCGACHLDRWKASLEPPHAELALPQTCDSCHTTEAWPGASFDLHDDFFALDGAHAALDCAACHAAGYAGTSAACYDCHAEEYAGAEDHAARGFPKTCSSCHTTERWEPPTWTGHEWPLTGAHAAAQCAACHGEDPRAPVPTDCAGCHQSDYDGTTDPDHVAQGFPTTCEVCHGTTKWEPATFAGHDAVWPLEGQHETAACTSCHGDGAYTGTPRECVGCHQADYDGTTDPDHVAAGYPTTCEGCHSPAAWKPAAFGDHDAFWPLEGKHATASCDGCHGGGVYAGTTKVCAGCHQADYDGTTNPDHAAVGISGGCDTCHTPASWATNKFPGHNALFPITSGNHKGIACAKCHTTSGRWDLFSCVSCHNLSKMNKEHQGEVGGYQSTLDAAPTVDHGCLKCHPKGTEDD